MEEDYYEILGISRTASGDEIKSSFRKLALKYHPDRNQGDKNAEEKFKKINEAYQILSDPQKRSTYDRYGKSGLNGMGGGFGGFEDFDLGDIFSSFFGGGFTSSARNRRRNTDNYELDIEIPLTLTFKEAVFGVKKEINYKIKIPCEKCNGTGAKDGKKVTCPHCSGSGKISQRQGFMSFIQTCPYCSGSGEIAKEKCSHCNAKGYEEESTSATINIPAGVDNATKIRVSSKGNLSASGISGDMYIRISVKDDEYFIRNNDDIYIEVPVFFTQAILGATLNIPNLKGEKLELKLPVGAHDKQQFIFNNEGVVNLRSGLKGRLIAQISIKTPKKLSSQQIELLEKLEATFDVKSDHDNSLEDSILDKIKNWFNKKD